LTAVKEVYDARLSRIPTSELNKLVRNAVDKHPPPQKGGIRVKFLYATQAAIDPPTFVFFVNKPDWVHFSYRRYLENQIRQVHPFIGSPIRLVFRQKSDDRYSEKI
jgi:GTP-binding protein